jgi:LuxR family transcriptional regulator, maltose regulon positive regulatory protein
MGEGTATTTTTTSGLRRRRIIERPRLTRLLDESQGRIKMLIAPAGYGKTTLARQWLADKRAVWYTATPASADVAALAAGLKEAVAQAVPGAGDALIERLSVTSRPEDETRVLETMLARDLAEWPASTWLVIDDYHEVSRSASAERFVEHLLLDAPLNSIVISRRRPRWASSRRLLYGELVEVDRAAMAMSELEAADVLNQPPDAPSELIAAARGWPAVLALASVAGVRPRGLVTEPQLYDFFADEIFGRLDRRTRTTLAELSLYDRGGRTLVMARLGRDVAEHVTAVGLACGFLTEEGRGNVELHPLAREFLRVKLRNENSATLAAIVETALATLLNERHWDEARSLIDEFGRVDLLPQLVEQSMEELLSSGRSATLRSWLGESVVTHPALLVASAELAFREGRFYEAEALASHAAGDAAVDSELAARAAIVAGRAAHVASRETQARAYFETAQRLSADERVRWRASLGAVVAAIELEDPATEELLISLEPATPVDPADSVAIADRHLAYETRFCKPVDLHRGRAASQLLRFVREPIARTSFRNIFGYALASTGNWDEAEALTDDQLADAERCRLDFVVPYALLLKAMVSIGRRQYAEAAQYLRDAEARARATNDLAAIQMVAAVRGRALIAQGEFEEAVVRCDVDISNATRSLRGELLGVKALALAGAGHLERAEALARESLEASLGVETVINAHSALAVTALTRRDHQLALDHAAQALMNAANTGMIESFLCAYRGCPQLIVCLLERRDLHDTLTRLLQRAGDAQLTTSAGLQPGESSVLSLSPREKEVLALLAQGLSNPAIGQALFISPVTVKVHVRHIFEKLGVRSRAEAALRAAQLDRGLGDDNRSG